MSSQTGTPSLIPRQTIGSGSGPGVKMRFSSKVP